MLVPILAVWLAAAGAPEWPTLRQELQKQGVHGNFDDADRRITSYAVQADAGWFAIAYYWFDGTELLPPELRLRVLDRRRGVWQHRMLHDDVHRGGSALHIHRAGGFIYIDLHRTPSAGSLIVLTERLELKRQLNGWASLLLPDGRMLYENNMIHFAPAHAGSVSLFEPTTNRTIRVYPARRENGVGLPWIDRGIVSVRQRGRRTIEIVAREQNVAVTTSNTPRLLGKSRDISITCDIGQATPRCRVRRMSRKNPALR